MGCVCVSICRKWSNATTGNMVTRKQDQNNILLVKAGRESEIKPYAEKVLTKFHDVL